MRARTSISTLHHSIPTASSKIGEQNFAAVGMVQNGGEEIEVQKR